MASDWRRRPPTRTPTICAPSGRSSATSSRRSAPVAEFAGVPLGQGRRIGVVVSRFNEGITERLERGATDALLRAGVAADDVDVIRVPGAWELPHAARAALATEQY